MQQTVNRATSVQQVRFFVLTKAQDAKTHIKAHIKPAMTTHTLNPFHQPSRHAHAFQGTKVSGIADQHSTHHTRCSTSSLRQLNCRLLRVSCHLRFQIYSCHLPDRCGQQKSVPRRDRLRRGHSMQEGSLRTTAPPHLRTCATARLYHGSSPPQPPCAHACVYRPNAALFRAPALPKHQPFRPNPPHAPPPPTRPPS